MKKSVLMVDDEPGLISAGKKILTEEGFQVKTAESAEEALERVKAAAPDVMILDVRLPGMSGFDLCKVLRADKTIPPFPILFLSSKGEESSKILGLEMGGDDYLTKPFSAPELLARVRAILRRMSAPVQEEEILTAGPLTVKMSERVVDLDGKRVEMPRKEFDLLCLLLRKKKKVLTRTFLLENIWGRDYSEMSRTVDTHVKKLRHDLAPLRDRIKTVEGVGYKWEDPE